MGSFAYKRDWVGTVYYSATYMNCAVDHKLVAWTADQLHYANSILLAGKADGLPVLHVDGTSNLMSTRGSQMKHNEYVNLSLLDEIS